MKQLIIFLCLLIVSLGCLSQSFEWSNLSPGIYKTGFKVVEQRDKTGQLILFCIWYPANSNGERMTLRSYVETGLEKGDQEKQMLVDQFKSTMELPFLFGLKELTASEYNNVLMTPVNATMNAKIKEGTWPLVISDTEPVSLFVTNEWLASHGFVVAAPVTRFPSPENDSVLYKGPTEALGFLLEDLVRQSYIDSSNISALGFGGGSMAAFFLAMKTNKIKAFANIEGGIFQSRSKTSLSKDYHPEKFSIPFLHVVRPEITNDENPVEFKAINAPKYRVTQKNAGIRHHDFTVYGRVVNAVLKQRGDEAGLVTKVFGEVNEMILHFFIHRNLDSSVIKSPGLFGLEKF
ncbi:MAG: hypothetical protein ACXWV1_14920 [Chitinophagaceae bacterium]